MLTKRTNILFAEKHWKELTRIAKKKNTSAAELVRRAVTESYFSGGQNQRASRSYESIIHNRKQASGGVNYKALIDEGRCL